MKVTWNSKEVHDPVVRVILVVGLIVVVVGLSPVWLPGHLVLIALGRKGFVHPEPYGKVSISLNPDAFRRA